MKSNKILFSLFFLCIVYSVKCQSISVIYKEVMVKNPIDTTGITSGDYKMVMFNEMEKVKKILKNVDYLMQANSNEALFQYREFMENDANPMMMNAILASSANGKFYSNKTEDLNFRHFRGRNGTYYRISDSEKTKNWKITKITKKIGRYTCYKATNKILLNNTLPIEVVAWFTPEIPFSFGPKGYGGLPGLIIALDERGFYFYAENIKFHDKTLPIKKPTKGKLLTPDEYDELVKFKYN